MNKKKLIAATAIVGGAAYLASVLPSSQKHRDAKFFLNRTFAHRGLHNNTTVMENSMPSFVEALEEGYGIEMDLRMTKDGQIVLFHDDTLARICGSEKTVEELTYKELCQFRLGTTEDTIPLLTQVLEIVDNKVPLILEVKNTCAIAPLCEAIHLILKEYEGIYCVESFNPYIVEWFRINMPYVMRGVLSMRYNGQKEFNHLQGFVLSNMLLNYRARPHFIAYHHDDVDKISLRVCRRAGAPVFGWTITGREEMLPAAKIFDALIFEGFRPHRNIV